MKLPLTIHIPHIPSFHSNRSGL